MKFNQKLLITALAALSVSALSQADIAQAHQWILEIGNQLKQPAQLTEKDLQEISKKLQKLTETTRSPNRKEAIAKLQKTFDEIQAKRGVSAGAPKKEAKEKKEREEKFKTEEEGSFGSPTPSTQEKLGQQQARLTMEKLQRSLRQSSNRQDHHQLNLQQGHKKHLQSN